MIKNVEGLDAELSLYLLSELEGFGDREIHVVEAGIAKDIAAHVAKLSGTVRNQDRIAHHIAIVGAGERAHRSRAKGSGGIQASRRNGACASPAAARTETRKPIGADGSEVRWVANEIPTVGVFVGAAEII